MDISVETILVAIIDGLGGGALGTWLRSATSAETFRERLITAADDLSTGLLQAIIGLDDAYSVCLKHGFLTPQGGGITLRNPATGETPSEIADALNRSKALIGEAHARRARVALLFGPVSSPDRSASLAIIGLDLSLGALEEWPVPDLEAFSRELARARKYLDEFNRSALRDIQGRPWYARWRLVLWLRRHARRLAAWAMRRGHRAAQ